MKAMFFVGLVMMIGGAGTVELSTTTVEMLEGVVVAVIGAGISLATVKAVKE